MESLGRRFALEPGDPTAVAAAVIRVILTTRINEAADARVHGSM